MLPNSPLSLSIALAMVIGMAWSLSGQPSHAQEQAKDARFALVAHDQASFQAWHLACFEDPNQAQESLGCSISTRFDLQNSNEQGDERNTLLVFSVTYSESTDGPVGVFSLPLGVYLPSGLALVFGGSQSLRLPFETCNQTGCHAGMLLNSDVNALLQDGESMEVMFQNERQQTIKLPLSLKGYTAAVQALARRKTAS